MGGMVLPWLVGQIIEKAGTQTLFYIILNSLVLDLATFITLLHTARKVIIPTCPEASVSVAAK